MLLLKQQKRTDMDLIYYTSSILLILLLIALPILTLVFLIKPHLLNKRVKRPVSRPKILLLGIAVVLLVFFGLGSVVAAIEPDGLKQARIAEQQAAEKPRKVQEIGKTEEARQRKQAEKPVIKTELKKELIAYETIEQQDGTLAKGKTRTAVEGVNGERTTTYEVTYVKNIETSRKEVSSKVTTPSVTKVVKIGTYEAPAPAAPAGGSGYTNSQGNYVPSPSSNPAGATAQCADGTYSYSQSRRGTCSHHGGVARWL